MPLGLILASSTPRLLILLSYKGKYTECFIIKQILCNKNSMIIYNKTNQM
nr:MAG TPA: hypothetical protein [Caudoviricetes sp.]